MAKRGPKPKAKEPKTIETPLPDSEMENEVEAMFDEEKYRAECLARKRIEAEVDVQVKKEMSKKLDIDVEAQKKRKPSIEEICVKTHPMIKCRIAAPGQKIIEFTWGGKRWKFEPNEEVEIPLGVAEHLAHDCGIAKYKYISNSDGTGQTVFDRMDPAYHVTYLNPGHYAEALAECRAEGYIPIPERGENAKT